MTRPTVDRQDVMNALHHALRDELVIGGLGNQSYDLYLAGDRPANFYMWGAMGLAPSVALGVAIAAPESRVIALEGDGGTLMNLGALATIGASRPDNLGIIIFDNHVYDLTGRQETAAAKGTDLAAVARGCGIDLTTRVSDLEDFTSTLSKMLLEPGPWCMVVDTAPTRSDRKKPLVELRRRFVQLDSFTDAAKATHGVRT
jgi:thiamine pyrophosphate-dependent acetolactate synthase large subunit-like protein